MLRLGDSASQTAVDENIARYAKAAVSYISKLEAKLRAYEEVSETMGDCPLAQFLAEEVEREVAHNDTPDFPDNQGWTADETEEWEKWQAEKWALREDDLAEEGSQVWEEDAQPPSEHLRAAAKAPHVSSPTPARAVAPKMNSLTHRADYMRLVSRLSW